MYTLWKNKFPINESPYTVIKYIRVTYASRCSNNCEVVVHAYCITEPMPHLLNRTVQSIMQIPTIVNARTIDIANIDKRFADMHRC